MFSWQLSDSDHDDEEFNECNRKSGQLGLSAYKRLITIHAGKPMGALKDALQVATDKVRRLSMSEQELEKAAGSHGSNVVRYLSNSQRCLSFSYHLLIHILLVILIIHANIFSGLHRRIS